MRLFLALLALCFVAVLGCKQHRSKLDDVSSVVRGPDADALWALAPGDTELGLVATPRAVELAARGLAAMRTLAEQPEFAPLKDQLDSIVRRMFGSPTGTPADAGYATDRGFAMFATKNGIIAVMPVGDRDKFVALKKGTRGDVDDTIDSNTCRAIKNQYVCATNAALFNDLGKGSLAGKLDAGARGDVELYMTQMSLVGDTQGKLALAAQLDPGELSVFARWTGDPSGVLGKLAGVKAPHGDTQGASGFVALDVAPLVTDLPAMPITGDLTLDQLAKTLRGPVTVTVPGGSVDIQLFAALADPKPATTAIEHCQDLGRFLTIADKQVPGACRLLLQGTNALELDTWVEGNVLRFGAKKGPPPRGAPGAMTRVGRELASGEWSAALWGRGTMLNLTGVKPASTEVDPQVAVGIHALSLINELGLAAKVEKTGVRFRGYLRTAWTNAPALVGKLIAITGSDIVSGKATEPAKALATASPGSPFAEDFAAGQGGLMIPAAVIGLGSAVVVPLVLRALGVEEDPKPEPVDKAQLTMLLVRAYVDEAYPRWKAEHPDQQCPATLVEVAKYFNNDVSVPVLVDPWGHTLGMICDKDGFKVLSTGPDGKSGTDDDVRSW